jgi:hypothetical protein
MCEPCDLEIELEDPDYVIPVLQGGKGDPGPPGSAGGSRYTHTQSSPSASWVVNHNMGVYPAAVSVLSSGRVEVEATVTHNSLNQLTVSFAAPFTGSVEIV